MYFLFSLLYLMRNVSSHKKCDIKWDTSYTIESHITFESRCPFDIKKKRVKIMELYLIGR